MGLSAADPSSGASALQVSSLWVSGVGTSGGGGGSVPPLLICGDMALPQWPLGHLSDPSPWAEDRSTWVLTSQSRQVTRAIRGREGAEQEHKEGEMCSWPQRGGKECPSVSSTHGYFDSRPQLLVGKSVLVSVSVITS